MIILNIYYYYYYIFDDLYCAFVSSYLNDMNRDDIDGNQNNNDKYETTTARK
jgi:hypothetical protein